jgi:hypothetical protein
VSDNHPTAVFGLEDGCSSAMGVILGAGITLSSRALLVAAVALAVAASVSMAGGLWLSNGDKRQAFVMAGATLVGSFLPAVPWLVVSGALAFGLCVAIAVALGVLIAELRPGKPLASYAQTFGVLIVATGAAVGASLIAGALA